MAFVFLGTERGRWRVAALVPLVWMVPVVVVTAQALREGSNLWPCLLIPASLGTAAYLGVIIAVHSSAARAKDRQGFDVLPPRARDVAGKSDGT